MIIGFDGSRAFGKDRTGTENYSYQVLKNISKVDTKNTYKVFLRPNSLVEKDWPENFKFITIKWPRLWTQGGLALNSFLEDLDLLFVPAHTLPIFHRRGLKTVVTVHDLGSEYLPQTHQIKQRLYLSFMQKFQLKHATKLIAVSNATKDDLVKKVGVEAKKVKVVYEGYNKELYKPVKNDAIHSTLSNYNIEKDRYFLFVGTVQPRKNLERLIEAYAMYSGRQPRAKLVIVGKKGWKSEDIYRLPKKLGVQDKVKFLDYIPDKDMPALYSGARALLFPSLFEGFGLPILEAQACGCPVITSNISSMPEVAGKGAILVDPYNINDIVEGMEKVGATGVGQQLKSVSSQASLIKNGFENKNKFSWEKCAEETVQLLKEVYEAKPLI